MRRRYSSSFHRTKARGVFVFYVVLLSFFIVIFRLVYLQLFKNKEFQAIAKSQYQEEITLQAKRGSIFDRNGNPLAESLVASSVIANPHQVKDREKAALLLSKSLKISYKNIIEKLSQDTYFVWIARKITEEEAQLIMQQKIEGVEIIKEPTGRRFYPKEELASSLLGYTGVDDQGLEGIEFFYDEELKGKTGKIQMERDAFGRAIPDGKWEVIPAMNGMHLATTVDETIQYVAERELKKGIKETKAASGTVIVMDPKNGNILAMANASYPDNISSQNDKEKNHALTDIYEPGSTFKTVLITAAVDSGKLKFNEKFYSGASLVVGGRAIHNADDGLTSPTGQEDMTGILTYSFNVGAASLGLRLGKETFYEYLDKFGFMSLTGIDLPGEGECLIPPLNEWTPLQLATISFGQGIAVTPLQLLRLYAALANGGYLVIPHIGHALVNDSGEVQKLLGFPSPSRIISEKTAKELQAMLQKVVEEGTGKKAIVPGYSVGGKTGTAQVVEQGAYVSGKYIASFVGFVPVEDPVMVVLVKVNEPKTMIWGGAVAAPIFQAIAREALWQMRLLPSSKVTQTFKAAQK